MIRAPHRSRRRGRRRRTKGRILPENGQLKLGQLGRRIDAQLVDEGGAKPVVRTKRVGLPAGCVQRPDQLALQAFAQRMGGGERLELREYVGVPGQGEVGVDPVFGGGQSELVEAGRRDWGERSIGEVGERRTAPEGLGLAQQRGRLDRPTRCERPSTGGREAFEPVRIHLVRLDAQAVADRPGFHDAGRPGFLAVGEDTPKPGYQRLQRIDRP
jgi:hypothetical protein